MDIELVIKIIEGLHPVIEVLKACSPFVEFATAVITLLAAVRWSRSNRK